MARHSVQENVIPATGPQPHAVKMVKNEVRFTYDANGNMTRRVEGSVTYDQTFNSENRLSSVGVGGSTTTFRYDADGGRVQTVEPGGKTTYYPFPGYEEEVNNGVVTRRATYSLGGQAVALRVQVVGGNNALYYLLTDHLGSTRRVLTASGAPVTGSTSRYLPFGGWRTEPTSNLTDRGFTGHLHNNLGSGADDLGLIYMNARYYNPYINRFVSADSIVPDPTNPQQYNRYSYVLNNPMTHT